MVGEHRAPFLVSVAALCGRTPRLARLAGAGNGVSVEGRPGLGSGPSQVGVSHGRVPSVVTVRKL